jgi:Fuc2NAc and GlcNAc transferase
MPGWLLKGTVVSFLVSVVVTPLIRAAAVRWGLLDRPNLRSSHRDATPRGGGVALVAAVVASLSVTYPRWTPGAGAGALFGGAVVIALVGLRDDRAGLMPLPKFALQLVAAALCVSGTGGLRRLPLPPPLDVALGPVGIPLAVLWIVAVINFYNFLDGIDGLAGIQGAVTGLGVAWAGWHPLATVIGAAVSAACVGFLMFNWHPARIFMGDVGSGFLGYTFATLPLLAAPAGREEAVLFVGMSLWLFLADASLTLGRRLARGARWHEAHREHLYQRLVILGSSQASVAAGIGAGAALMTGAALLVWNPDRASSAWWAVAALGVALTAFEATAVRQAGRKVRAG